MKPTDNSLRRRWKNATKKDMPPDIESLAIDLREKAVKRVEAGDAVFYAKPVNPIDYGDSMQEWDGHKP